MTNVCKHYSINIV
jgi:hypothetical protein